ncbi:hypothetical protein M501DRAFT_656170 [Patellaria atrata CBS 101060]|uniref:Uncharacterized protein n=1 Tax=Patellaria atrata CBS 101060 TaxID=1346257 RepID=A0A9P4SG35_9PEZI|nr:hypothetical protein M501DRAFT_656170 [Patellaria atrata CBS 101060]
MKIFTLHLSNDSFHKSNQNSLFINYWQNSAYNNSVKLNGAAEARRAHNPEDNGSKPFSAIFLIFYIILGYGDILFA